MDRQLVDITALGQAADGFYNILDDKSIYVIKDNCKVNIKAGIKAYVIDKTKNSEIYVNVGADSSLDYTIIDSYSTKRLFDVSGELLINEILLHESNESFTCNLLKEN